MFGWGYKIPLGPFEKMREDIEAFSQKIDNELNCTGCGFMLAFFYLSEKELTDFQNDYGYFPYDGYLSLWQSYTGMSQSYNQRNKCLETLVENKMISPTVNDSVFKSVNNPFEKMVNRNRNLATLIK